jgi:hypothetical protein
VAYTGSSCTNCYEYNDLVDRVNRELEVYGRARFLNDLQSRAENRPTRGRIGEALFVFQGNWLKAADGKPDIVKFELLRGIVPPSIFLARMAYDNSDYLTQDRRFLGGKTVACGLASQAVEKYVQFDLDPFDANTGPAASMLLLLHRLRAIAERRLQQYARIWNDAIFGSCPSTSVIGYVAERATNFRDWPKINGKGSRTWEQVEQAAKSGGFQDLGEALKNPPRQSIYLGGGGGVVGNRNYVLCGGTNPPAFWPVELATQKSFWHLVLLEERTTEDVGNKIWKHLINLWGPRGRDLPEEVLLLLYHKKRLYAPDLNKYLRVGLQRDATMLSGTGLDSQGLLGNLAAAEAIVSNAGYLGASTFINRHAWIPYYDRAAENEVRARQIVGDARRLHAKAGNLAFTIPVATALPGWGPAAESFVGTPQTGVVAPLATPPPSLAPPPSAYDLIPLPTSRHTKLATWKKLVLALSVGGAGLFGIYYYTTRRKGKS